jgi:hypothetical protein
MKHPPSGVVHLLPCQRLHIPLLICYHLLYPAPDPLQAHLPAVLQAHLPAVPLSVPPSTNENICDGQPLLALDLRDHLASLVTDKGDAPEAAAMVRRRGLIDVRGVVDIDL